MPQYSFIIGSGIPSDDREGTELPDDTSATSYGARIIRELKRDESNSFRNWMMEIKEGSRLVGTIPFDGVD